MFQSERLPQRRIVLLGIGHTNAHVLHQWRKSPLPDTELVCISDHHNATYSGMLPAVLGQQKPQSAMEINLVQLCASANARLLIDEVQGLDTSSKTIHLRDHPVVEFDALSIGIGSVPASEGVNLEQENVVTIKPMQTFLVRLRNSLLTTAAKVSKPFSILIVGGGAGGVEISCCLPGFLTEHCPELSYRITIVNRGEELISGSSERARNLIEKTLKSKGVEIVLNREVSSLDENSAKFTNGESIPAELIIWATGAAPPPLLQKLNLPLDQRGFLLTDKTLRVQSGEPIFAVGDTGTIAREKLPKAGVFAVREGPILWENLQRTLRNEPLKEYHPQRSFLRLLNTGDGEAIAEWFGLAIKGRLMMTWKDYIDSNFVSKYQVQD